jgi:hypothetical protein
MSKPLNIYGISIGSGGAGGSGGCGRIDVEEHYDAPYASLFKLLRKLKIIKNASQYNPATTTYTVPKTVQYISVKMVGGGGGAGGSSGV